MGGDSPASNVGPWTGWVLGLIGIATAAAGCHRSAAATSVQVTTTSASPLPIPPPARTSPPETPDSTRCVTDPLRDSTEWWRSQTAASQDVHASVSPEHGRRLGDLDGDGVEETVITNELQCGASGNCPLRVYFSGGGCAVLTLETDAASIWSTDVRTNGARTVESWGNSGCGGMAGGWTSHRFDGAQYEVASTVSCGCPYSGSSVANETPRAPQCPGKEDSIAESSMTVAG